MRPWPHAPPHWTYEAGIYFVTASTYQKEKMFSGADRLDLLTKLLVSTLEQSGWSLDAWAVLPNHYHLIVRSGEGSRTLSKVLGKVHMVTAKEVNRSNGTPGRKVWHNYRDTHLTFEKSHLSRLHYVIQNPVHHGIVLVPDQYRWCSAGWFQQNASRAFQKTVLGMPIDRLKVEDDFEL